MSEQKHSKEPWHVGEMLNAHEFSKECAQVLLVGAPGGDAAYVAYHAVGGDNAKQHANARRIVACVNACEGIPTEWLEQPGRKLRMFDIRTLESAEKES